VRERGRQRERERESLTPVAEIQSEIQLYHMAGIFGGGTCVCVCVCVCVCARARVLACVRACMLFCVYVHACVCLCAIFIERASAQADGPYFNTTAYFNSIFQQHISTCHPEISPSKTLPFLFFSFLFFFRPRSRARNQDKSGDGKKGTGRQEGRSGGGEARGNGRCSHSQLFCQNPSLS